MKAKNTRENTGHIDNGIKDQAYMPTGLAALMYYGSTWSTLCNHLDMPLRKTNHC